MPKLSTKKTPTYRYGIEITKPHSKEMYAHNDEIAYEMKSTLRAEINEAYLRATGQLAATGGMYKGGKDLRKIVQAFTGYGFSSDIELEDIKDKGINTLANVENFMLHQEYGYLCSEGIVSRLRMKMLGFDKAEDGCWDSYWEAGNKYTSQIQNK